jgi:hypothetical protein
LQSLWEFDIVGREPSILKKGKRFHKLVQIDWCLTANDGLVEPEQNVLTPKGKRGRIDILVEEITPGLVSIVEIKNTDWDKIKDIRRNIKRQSRQIWKYIDSQMELHKKDVCPGIIFPKLPNDSEKLRLIESMFENEGIQVVWNSESIEQVKARMKKKL